MSNMSGWLKIKMNLISVAVFLVVITTSSSSPTTNSGWEGDDDPPPIIFPGTVNIGLLLDLHSDSEDGRVCGKLNPSAEQKLLAAAWSAEVLNNQSTPSATRLGIVAYDACESPEVAARQILRLLHDSCSLEILKDNCNSSVAIPLLGVIGVASADVLASIAAPMSALSIPLVVASPGGAEGIVGVGNVLLTAPDMTSQVKPVLSVLQAFRWQSVRLITSSGAAWREFREQAEAADIYLTDTLQVLRGHLDANAIRKFLDNQEDEELVVVALLSVEELRHLTNTVPAEISRNVMWVIASPALGRSQLHEIGARIGTGLYVEPHSPELAGFSKFYQQNLPLLSSRLVAPDKNTAPESRPIADQANEDINTTTSHKQQPQINTNYAIVNDLNGEYKATNNPAVTEPEIHSIVACPLSPRPANSISEFQQAPGIVHVAEAVSAMGAALRILNLQSCHFADCSFKASLGQLGRGIQKALHSLGLSVRRGLPAELQGTRLRVTDSGRVVSIHSHVVFFNASAAPSLIGWYSEELGVTIESVPDALINFWETIQENQTRDNFSPGPEGSGVWIRKVSHGNRHRWAAPILAMAGTGVLITSYALIQAFLSWKRGLGITRGIGGIVLLIGVATLYVSSILFVLPSRGFVCGLRLFLPSTAYSMCYASLLTHLMALRSQELAGIRGKLSSLNQVLTLVLGFSSQITLSGYWWALSPSKTLNRCIVPNSSIVFLSMPSFVLLLAVILGSVLLRRHNDARSMLASSAACLTIWIAWSIIQVAGPTGLRDPATCAHLLTAATTLVLPLILPHIPLAFHAPSFKQLQPNGAANSIPVFSLTVPYSAKSENDNQSDVVVQNSLQTFHLRS